MVSAILTRAGKDVTIQEVVLNPTTYVKDLKRWYGDKVTTHKTMISTLLGLFRYNEDFKYKHKKIYDVWLEEFQRVKKLVEARYEANKPSERQIQGYVPYAEIVEARDKLPEGHLHRVLLGMYTHLRPMRCEYARVAIFRGKVPANNEEPNFILLKAGEGRLILRHFKTRKHHEAYNLELPKPLVNDIVKSLEEAPRDWLFVNRSQEPYLNHLYTKWTMRVFQTIFKKPLTVALIRHSFVNTLDMNKLSIAEKKEIALSMAHTVEMQDRYRLLFDDEKLSCDCVCEAKK